MIRVVMLIMVGLISCMSSVVYAEKGLVEIDGASYWHANRNMIYLPLSSGSSGRYSVIDLSSIDIKENNDKKIELSMTGYNISPTGDMEGSFITYISKEKMSGFFEEGNVRKHKIKLSPINISAYYSFIKNIEKSTQGKVKAVDIFDGYVCKRKEYVWFVPKMPKKIGGKWEATDYLAIFDYNLPKVMQKDLGTDVMILLICMYYIGGQNEYDKFNIIEKNDVFARNLSGKWVRVKEVDIKKFMDNGGLSNNTNWEELPKGNLGELMKEVCEFSVQYLSTGKM